MRRTLVLPGVPKGTPAVMTRRWPSTAMPSWKAIVGRLLDHFGESADVASVDAMDAVGQDKAAGGFQARGQRQDRHVGALADGAKGGRS